MKQNQNAFKTLWNHPRRWRGIGMIVGLLLIALMTANVVTNIFDLPYKFNTKGILQFSLSFWVINILLGTFGILLWFQKRPLISILSGLVFSISTTFIVSVWTSFRNEVSSMELFLIGILPGLFMGLLVFYLFGITYHDLLKELQDLDK